MMSGGVRAPRPGVLEAAVALSETMLREAQAAEWDALAELEEKRRALLSNAFNGPVPVTDATAVATAIRRILDCDRQLSVVVKNARDSLADKLRGLKHNRLALDSYRDQSR